MTAGPAERMGAVPAISKDEALAHRGWDHRVSIRRGEGTQRAPAGAVSGGDELQIERRDGRNGLRDDCLVEPDRWKPPITP